MTMIVSWRFSVLACLALLTACVAAPRAPISEEGDSVYGAFLAARYAGSVHDDAAAAAYYQRALAREPNNSLLIERAFVNALSSGDVDAAYQLAERAIDLEEASRLARLVLAAKDLIEEDYVSAQARLSGGDLGPFNRLVGTGMLAWAQAGQGKHDAALATLARTRTAPIGEGLGAVQEALLLAHAGRTQEAQSAFAAAYANGYLRPAVLDAYGRFLERHGELESARALYETVVSGEPLLSIATAGLARLDAGKSDTDFFVTPQQGASLAVFGPAAALASEAAGDLAELYLQLAIALDPDAGGARLLLGEILANDERPVQARAVYKGVSGASPYYESAQIAAAFVYLDDEKQDAGVALLRDLAESTGSARAKATLADALVGTQAFEEAREIYTVLIADLGDAPAQSDWRLFYARGVTHHETDRWPEAEADFRSALALDPNQASVLNYLGYSWVDRGENLDEAFQMIRKAVRLRPDAGFIVDSLGWAHYRMGRYEEAVRHLERAVELDPQSATINDHLGDAYWKVGRRLEAAFQWRRALTLEPEDDERDAILAKLDGQTPDEAERARLAGP